ncbi:MAG: endonuclease/exonuclease/phosphatase family protein [Fidelibacterota bacterium]|nr:MAG: endonuclease/exonuclease/phosphatase family protein [Candidatus Neomarinimicrobiota bacterium]
MSLRKVHLLLSVLIIGGLSAQELTFVTINVWSGLDYKGIVRMGEYESRQVRQARYQLLVEELQALKPDVIAVNEANPLPGYVRRLATDLDYDYIYNVGMSGMKIGCLGIPANFKEGDAILARKSLSLDKVGAKRLSSGAGYIGNLCSLHFAESNQAIAGRIRVNGQSVFIVNTHLHAGLPDDQRWRREMDMIHQSGSMTDEEYQYVVEWWRGGIDRRQNEVQALLAWMRAVIPQEAPVILMGDFNAGPQSEEIAWLQVEDFVDTWSQSHEPDDAGITWGPKENANIQTYYDVPDPYDASVSIYEKLKALNRQVARRIDYILVKNVPREHIMTGEVVLDHAPGGQHPSDHFGVLTKINFNPE